MPGFSEYVDEVIDCHVHLWSLETLESLMEIRRRLGVGRMNLVSIVDPRTGAGHAQGFVAKAAEPKVFYCFGGLDHTEAISAGKASAGPLADQIDRLMAAGCDGIKLLEGKPTTRRELPFALDGEYYRDFFAAAEEKQTPLLWHVADPEEFWDQRLAPAWAVSHGWTYGPDDVPKEQLHQEVENVLQRHPRLRVIFAHFYFLSADLRRLGAFLDAHPAVNIDVTPGVELMLNLSRDPQAARRFFLDYQDRILYGTDILSDQQSDAAVGRAGLVRQFLESDGPFRVPAEADELLEPDNPNVHGLGLPPATLEKIYRKNFEAFAGVSPRPLDRDKATDECLRQAETAAQLSGCRPDRTEAGRCAAALTAAKDS